ncbi:MAG: hypothetical protein ACKO3A_02195 [Opitutia bacterium]
MTAPEATPASRRRLVRAGAAGLVVLAVVAAGLALRPEPEVRRIASNSPVSAPAPPPGSGAPAPSEDSGFFADFFKPRGEKSEPVAGIGGADGGTGPRKAEAAKADLVAKPPLDPAPYDFSPSARRDPAKLAALLADMRARVLDGRWEEHLAKLQPGLRAALVATKADPDGKAYEELWREPLFAVGAGQALLIARAGSTEGFSTRTGPESLRRLTESEGLAGFLEDLLRRPAWMETFLAQVKPEDEVPAALKVWALAWNADPLPLRGKYLRLQVAFALVFDRERTLAQEPEEAINPLTRYAFFRSAAEEGRLKTDVTKLPVDALLWVAGSEAGDPDLHWAQAETMLRRLDADDWAKAYQVVWDGGTMAKLLTPTNRPSGRNAEPKLSKTAQAKIAEVDAGSLEFSFKFGGDPVAFAVESARAFGIPAATLLGRAGGRSGPPRWAAFQKDPRRWELGLGRPATGAANGTAPDPQTGLPVGEFELAALVERRRTSPEADRCTRLRLLARLAAQLGDAGRQQACLAAACRAYDRSLPAWRERLAAMATDEAAPTAPWAATLAELRRAFADSADMRDLADEHETRFLLGRVSAAEAVQTIQGHLRKLLREFPGRRDLYLAGISRAARVLARDRSANEKEISALYREALENCAGDMAEFRGVLADYYATVKGEEKLERRFLDDAERVFRRKVDLPAAEFFEMTEELYVYFRKCGQGQQGLRLRKEGQKAREAAEKGSK